MSDKELQEWEAEAKEADEDIRNLFKIIIVGLIIGSTWFTYYGINLKLNVIMDNTNNSTITELQDEIMTIGHELDSMKLKYDY